MRIIQLTDLHVTAEADFALKGTCTRASLERVLVALERCAEPDQLLITGDLTHDEQLATYQWIRDRFSTYAGRLHVIPGNHDDRAAMRQVFPQGLESIHERITFVVQSDDWRIVGLDSHSPGELRGQLGQQQLEWLDQQLRHSAAQHQFVCLFLHHPPIHMNLGWLDEIGLEDSEQFVATVQKYSHVKLICTGHVHQERTSILGNAVVVTTPATGVQFRPNTTQLEVDSVPPGFRVIELQSDGRVNTWIERASP